MLERIEIGTSPDDGSGDSLRQAFEKVNANFAELAEALARLAAAPAPPAAPGWPGEWVARHVADTAPAAAPPLLGALWVDARSRTVWLAVGTATPADWVQLAAPGKAG